MTKFSINQSLLNQEQPKGKKTVFHKYVTREGLTRPPMTSVCDWDNVVLLYRDKNYGDVFLAWNDTMSNSRALFFGEAGDEFGLLPPEL